MKSVVKKIHLVGNGAVLKVVKYTAEKINKNGETLFAFVDKGKRDFIKQERLGKHFRTDTLTYCVWSVE